MGQASLRRQREAIGKGKFLNLFLPNPRFPGPMMSCGNRWDTRLIGALSKKHQSTLKTSFHVSTRSDALSLNPYAAGQSLVDRDALRRWKRMGCERECRLTRPYKVWGHKCAKDVCRALEVTSEQKGLTSSAGCGRDVRKRLLWRINKLPLALEALCKAVLWHSWLEATIIITRESMVKTNVRVFIDQLDQ